MALTKLAAKKLAQIAAPKPTNAQIQYTSPAKTPETLIERARDKAWSVVQYYRLFRMYGEEREEYLPILDQLVREIQELQDQATDLEKSLAEEAELERNSELTSHMGPA